MTTQPVPPHPHRLATIPDRMALVAIRFYQRSISPHKGWCCAHRARYGGHSCSEWTKRAVARHGLHTGSMLARRRFARCHSAAMASRWETEAERTQREKKPPSIWTRPFACFCDGLPDAADPCADAYSVFECLSCGCDILQVFAWFV